MTRTMYDAVNPFAIPSGSQLVAGYVDGPRSKWADAAWTSFPGAVMVRIAVLPTTNDGVVLDVEQDDAEPSDVPGWLTMRRAAGVDPTVYCSPANIPAVSAACQAAGVAEPHFWVCNPDGDPTIPEGCVAKQWKWETGKDTSSVVDFWPGVDSLPSAPQVANPAATGTQVAEEDEMFTIPVVNADFMALLTAEVQGGVVVKQDDTNPKRFEVVLP